MAVRGALDGEVGVVGHDEDSGGQMGVIDFPRVSGGKVLDISAPWVVDLLAGVEACRAGWPEVAAKCHEKLISSNPAHLAHRFPTMADALRDQEFQQLVIHWERYCPFEKAEAMLQQIPSQQPRPTNEPIGSQMLTLLNK